MKMRHLGVSLLKGGAFIIYALLKLLPQQHKLVLISRLQNTSSIDFIEIQKQASQADPSLLVITLNHHMDSRLKHIFAILQEMYHLATAEACIVESYVISVSVLHHHKSLVVIQIWHALGAVKMFGHLAIGKPEGSSAEIARLMKMHRNYTYVTAGSAATIATYSKAFNVREDQIKTIGMPRVDYLLNPATNAQNIHAVRRKYAIATDKQVILYAPTFRKRHTVPYDELINAVDLSRYTLIIKQHPRDKTLLATDQTGVIVDQNFSLLELLPIADYVITDFSAAVFEAALLGKPLFFWLFDKDRYIKKRGLAIDNIAQLPGLQSSQIQDLTAAIAADRYDPQLVKDFADRYVTKQDGTSTKAILELAGVVS